MTLQQDKLKELKSEINKRFIVNFDTGKVFHKHTLKPAGFKREGYIYLWLGEKDIAAHKVIWVAATGTLPDKDIDHINLDREDNRIVNLRLASRSQNMLNTSAHRDSESQIKNVSFRKDTNKWSVRLSVNGMYKSFGSYEDLELAVFVAEEARNKYHGEFARHA